MASPIKIGEAGWRAYALQKGVNSVRYGEIDDGHGSPWERVETDGDFGPGTLTAVKACQAFLGITSDGIAGAATQKRILDYLGDRTHELVGTIPAGLMRGFAESEGANMLAATNWAIAGGVDCGPVQIRAYGPPYSSAVLLNVFDPMESLMEAANTFAANAADFYTAAWVARQGSRRRELAMRAAVMAHNWPAGALAIAKTGSCSSPGAECTWAPAGARFPDGTPVRTRGDWCQFYAMGGPHGEGAITKYVTSWS
jgi:hypothetical protein